MARRSPGLLPSQSEAGSIERPVLNTFPMPASRAIRYARIDTRHWARKPKAVMEALTRESAMEDIRDLFDKAVGEIERMLNTKTVVGEPMIVEGNTLIHKAEATVSVNGGKIYADATEEDMYAAIDGLVDKLDRQVKKHKEKLVDHHARDSAKRKYG